MRVTSSSYFNNIYGENNKLNRQLYDVNRQISSGLKIQYAHDDPSTFIDTMRLDDEITTLTQIKTSAQNAYKFSTQTDTTIGEIVKTIESMKVKFINAANDLHSDTSLQAIAKELRGLEQHLLSLANTSIGGQYLFSGTATSVKPIGTDGSYQGNDEDLKAFLGTGVNQKYNISGAQLFSGDESTVNRTISTNIPMMKLTDLYPDVLTDTATPRSNAAETYITGSDTIRDIMGDTDTDPTNDTNQAYFYVQGTKSDGTAFKSKIALDTDASIDDLLNDISDLYGENQVDVSLNEYGQIEIVDKKSGSSKLDFHMVGAIDLSGSGNANVTDIDNLQSGTTDFEDVIDGSNLLYVKEFTHSGYDSVNASDTIEGINYDRTMFEQDGPKLYSNSAQIIEPGNTFATPSSKLVDVAGVSSLDGQQLIVEGTDINGNTVNVQIDFASAGTTFSFDGGATDYPVFTATAPRGAVDSDEMTYQQLMDVVNIAMSGIGATPSTAAAYDTAVQSASSHSAVTLENGKIVFEDKDNPVTQAQLSIYDALSSDYSSTQGAVLSFNANSAIAARDPKTDFFAQIDEMISAVEEGKLRADGTDDTDPRNIGIQNAIQMIDDLSEHVSRMQTEVGSYSQVLQASSDRADLLIVSTKTLRSDVIDTDIAEATLQLNQLTLNYQAMLSSLAKVSQLSLVNYL